MDDLLQSQIRDSCRLALPEGLRDLMSDISREVLRAQPPYLYDFIVSYLEALLLARDTLCVACRVCHDVCKCTCHPELDEALRNIGLDEEDLETAKNLVTEYFDKGDVNEGNLMMKLFDKTDIDADLIPDVQDAVRAAFQKHLRLHQAKYWAEAQKNNEIGQIAANHTQQYYDRVQEDKELAWEEAATKIQASVRGNLVKAPSDELALKLKGKLAQIESSTTMLHSVTTLQDDTEKASTSRPVKNNIIRHSLSSSSLAGSLINLPKYVPYSVHEITYVDFEERETERKNIDYTLETIKDSKKEEGSKKIGFYGQHVLHEIKSCSIEEESVIEEQIVENVPSEAVSVDENVSDDISVGDVDEGLEIALDEDNVNEVNIKDLDNSTSDNQEVKEELEGTSNDEQIYEYKYLDDKRNDGSYFEEEIEDLDNMKVDSNVIVEISSQNEKIISNSKSTISEGSSSE